MYNLPGINNLTKILSAIAVCGLVDAAPAAAQSLLGETLNANIVITGQDDNGIYTLPVLTGPVAVGAGFSENIAVFKQLTEGGFSSPSNTIDGAVVVEIGANTISVGMFGQVQPFELESQFSGIGGSSFHIVNVADSATGVWFGVNMDLFSNFTSNSVDFASYYLGYQTGTELIQTETFTFAPGAAVPEASTWGMMLLGFVGLGFAGFRRADRLAAAA